MEQLLGILTVLPRVLNLAIGFKCQGLYGEQAQGNLLEAQGRFLISVFPMAAVAVTNPITLYYSPRTCNLRIGMSVHMDVNYYIMQY